MPTIKAFSFINSTFRKGTNGNYSVFLTHRLAVMVISIGCNVSLNCLYICLSCFDLTVEKVTLEPSLDTAAQIPLVSQ